LEVVETETGNADGGKVKSMMIQHSIDISSSSSSTSCVCCVAVVIYINKLKGFSFSMPRSSDVLIQTNTQEDEEQLK